ncbi:MAG: hypothetical protein QOE94_838 [Mycobacterium sp.]|nr:hypothetical protein [Mycobacterium sp.]
MSVRTLSRTRGDIPRTGESDTPMDDATAAELIRRVEKLEAQADELLSWKQQVERDETLARHQMASYGLGR